MSDKYFRIFLRYGVAVVLMVILPTGLLIAQGTRGTISGSILDPQQSVVQNATVRLIDSRKHMTIQTVISDEDGEYHFLEVEPSIYEIVATAPGFSETTLANVKVEPNRNLVLPVALSISGFKQEITVTGKRILMELESATLGSTVQRSHMEGLPLNGRNVMDLAYLQAGVVSSINPTVNIFGQGLGFGVNGNRGTENNTMFDGSNNNEIAVGGSTGFPSRPDALEEFRILTSNFEAEFGRNAGAVVNVVTRSGTNEYHGNARGFWRPTVLSSRKYFDPERRRYERKEVGGNFGGPVKLPGLYNGKGKTFFFVDYETRRQLIGDTRIVTGLPTAAERNGDFSRLRDASGNIVTLVDPSTGSPFPENKIPSQRLSPIAQYYMNFLPVADENGNAWAGADETENVTYVMFRIDHQISDRNMLNFSSNIFDRTIMEPFAFGGADVPGFASLDKRRTSNYVVRDTHFFTPSLVNSLLLSHARNSMPSIAPFNMDTPAKIGFTADFVVDPAWAGPPLISLEERGLIFGNSYQGPQARVTENFQIQDSVSWMKGNHRFKFGFDGTRYRQDYSFAFINNGILGFSGVWGGNSTGDDLADFLIGNTPAYNQYGSNGLRDFRQHSASFFGQDAWRVANGLTLTLGLRWEYSSPITDKYDRMTFYRPGVVSELLTSGKVTQMDGTPVVVPAGERAPMGIVYVGDHDPVLGGTVPRGGVARDFNNWAPRFGLAWSPKGSGGRLMRLLGDEKTVIRAGFGIYYGALVGDTALQQLTAVGFNSTEAYYYPGSGTLADPFGPDPYPNYRTSDDFALDLGQYPNPFSHTGAAAEVYSPLYAVPRAIDPRIRTPYVYQYNLTIDRGLWNDYLLSLSYVGNRGVKLYAMEQVNYAYGTFIRNPDGTVYDNITTSANNVNSRRINTDVWHGIDMSVAKGSSNYNAFEAQVQKTYGPGIKFQAYYTFSKSISDSDSSQDYLDLLDRRWTRGLSSMDVPHRFVGSWIYELPFARNLGISWKRFLDGWSVNGIVTFQSGTPFSVKNVYDTDATGGAIVSYADLGAPLVHMDPRRDGNRAFNADAFQVFGNPSSDEPISFDITTDYRRGTSRRNQYRLNNGLNNWDLAIVKHTPLWNETARLELRFEMFNAFNHTQFRNVDLNISNKGRETFGQYISTAEPRIIQLGARINF